MGVINKDGSKIYKYTNFDQIAAFLFSARLSEQRNHALTYTLMRSTGEFANNAFDQRTMCSEKLGRARKACLPEPARGKVGLG